MRTRRRRSRLRSARLCAPLLAVVALATYAQPAAALSPGGNGVDATCQQGPASVTTQFQTPTKVDIAGGGGIDCPAPGNNSGSGFGATGPGPDTNFGQPQLNTPCHIVEELPLQFRYPGVGPQFQYTTPFNLIEKFASNQTTTYPWHGGNFSTTDNPPGVTYIDGDQWYYSAGFGDWYMTWWYDGTWQTEPNGTIGCSGTTGWNSRCAGKSLFVQCFDFVQRAVVAPGPLPLPADLDLNAFVQNNVAGGTISSIPDNPRPGVANLATCFYLNGVTVGGAAADPGQSTTWEQIVVGPPVDGEGRSIYFVFLIRVTYDKTEWTWGDNQPNTDLAQGGSQLDQNCPARNGSQFFAASHVYNQYSTGGGFPVTVTHHFTVRATEVWTDTNNQTNTSPFPTLDVAVPGGPQPFLKPIVQEEGVPVGG